MQCYTGARESTRFAREKLEENIIIRRKDANERTNGGKEGIGGGGKHVSLFLRVAVVLVVFTACRSFSSRRTFYCANLQWKRLRAYTCVCTVGGRYRAGISSLLRKKKEKGRYDCYTGDIFSWE